MNRVKVTAAGVKEISRLAPQVASEVTELCKQNRTRRINFCQHAAGWQMYLAEGSTYSVYPPNGKIMTTHMLSNDTLGSQSDGVNYHVGTQTPAMPEGTWVVEFQRFMGAPYITVHYVGQTALSAA